VVDELRGRSVDVSDPVPVGRNRQSFLHDPAGNLIELHEASSR
jgi:glyoxylase I family protein